MILEKDCSEKCLFSSKYGECVQIENILGIIESLENDYSVKRIGKIFIAEELKDGDYSYSSIKHSDVVDLKFSCLFLRKSSLEDLRAIVINACEFVFYEVTDDCEKNRESDFNSLSPEEKIERLIKKLNLSDNSEIQTNEKSGMRGHTDGEKIAITLDALEQLSEEEIAFILAHEQAHIDCKHVGEIRELIKTVCDEVRVVAEKNGGVLKKSMKIGGLALLGTIAFSMKSHSHEHEADQKAKIMLKEAGYSGNGGDDLLGRFDKKGRRFSFTHPSPAARRKKIKKS